MGKSLSPNKLLGKSLQGEKLLFSDESATIQPLSVIKSDQRKDLSESLARPLHGAIFVKNDHVYEKVLLSDILWVVADGAYCRLKTINTELLLCINLSAFQRQVKIPYIVRVHRSYIINTNRIEAFEPNYLHIQGELIPLGPKYKDNLIQAFPYIDQTGIIIKK